MGEITVQIAVLGLWRGNGLGGRSNEAMGEVTSQRMAVMGL